MTSDETKKLLDNIVDEVNTGADFIGVIAPNLIPFILLGKAVDKLIPGMVSQIQKWVEGNPPTPEEIAELRKKLSVLGDPNLP